MPIGSPVQVERSVKVARMPRSHRLSMRHPGPLNPRFASVIFDRAWLVHLEAKSPGRRRGPTGGLDSPAGLRNPLVRVDEGHDARIGLGDRAMHTPLPPLPRQFGGPALDPHWEAQNLHGVRCTCRLPHRWRHQARRRASSCRGGHAPEGTSTLPNSATRPRPCLSSNRLLLRSSGGLVASVAGEN